MTTSASRDIVLAKVWPALTEEVKEKLDDEVERLGVPSMTW